MKYFKGLLIVTITLLTHQLRAQTDFDMFDMKSVVSLSINIDPFSTYAVGKDFNLPEVDIFRDKFDKRPEIDMVAAAQRKTYRAQQQQEQKFSFIERQTAIFSNNKPKIDNSSSSPFAPSYHQQPIYSDLNRVKNSAYEDLGDRHRRLSPFYQVSPFRRTTGSGFYFMR
jgi:hypothetical protein